MSIVSNYRVGYEDPAATRGGPYVPGYQPEAPRSLVLPRPDVLPRPPGADATLPLRMLPAEVQGLSAELQRLVVAMDVLLRRAPLATVEQPFQGWRVDRITLVNTAVTWLDQFNPVIAGQQRFLKGRRGVIIVNHDLVNNIWLRHTDGGVAAQGGVIAAGGSITLPLGEKATIYATALAATSVISFYQLN